MNKKKKKQTLVIMEISDNFNRYIWFQSSEWVTVRNLHIPPLLCSAMWSLQPWGVGVQLPQEINPPRWIIQLPSKCMKTGLISPNDRYVREISAPHPPPHEK